MTLDIRALNRMLDELGPTVAKGADYQAPVTPDLHKAGDVNEQPFGAAYNFLSRDDSFMIQRKLNKLSFEEQGYLLQKQIEAGEGRGVPLRAWQANQWGAGSEVIQKALDTSGGAALIRQDLDPFLVSMFVSLFPAWQRIPKEPANGLVSTGPSRFAFA